MGSSRSCAAFLLFVFRLSSSDKLPPHIIFILADDLGWNDVSFHGESQIPTPNIDALAYNGVILNSHYSLPLCTPSRSALLTGKYPIHNGMQRNLIIEPEPWGLPLADTLLPQYLSPLGYTSHAVGKWHLGFFKKDYTPTRRGFASHFGFWNGYQDYYSHVVQASFISYEGYDMRRNLDVAYDTRGHYSTDLFTNEAVRIITEHEVNNSSLFLFLSHLAPHSGNYEDPLQAPAETIAKFTHIKDKDRRVYAAMVSKLDESVGTVIQALQKKGILNNTIVVFVSDNGATTVGIHDNSGSNWPLRGVKGTPWEGGVRTVALVWSNYLQKNKRVSNQMMHISDWLPTLYSAAGGNVSHLTDIDGIDMWDAISRDLPSPRSKLLINIDDQSGYSALIKGRYKYVNGSALFGNLDMWAGDPARDDPSPSYDIGAVLNSTVARMIASSPLASKKEMEELRHRAEIHCIGKPGKSCKPLKKACMFDIVADPCERRNLRDVYVDVFRDLEEQMLAYRLTEKRPNNVRSDTLANPKYWNNTWTFWQDLPFPSEAIRDHRSWW